LGRRHGENNVARQHGGVVLAITIRVQLDHVQR
jgi:hypothetical protein